jgi:hypothetical protein
MNKKTWYEDSVNRVELWMDDAYPNWRCTHQDLVKNRLYETYSVGEGESTMLVVHNKTVTGWPGQQEQEESAYYVVYDERMENSNGQ